MKKNLLSLLLLCSIGLVNAQEKTVTVNVEGEKGKNLKKVRIVKNVNGKMEVTERFISDDSLNSPIIITDKDGTSTINISGSDKDQVMISSGGKTKNVKKIRIVKDVNGKMEVTESIISDDSTHNPLIIDDMEPFNFKFESKDGQVFEGRNSRRPRKELRVYSDNGNMTWSSRELDSKMRKLSDDLKEIHTVRIKPFAFDDHDVRRIPNQGIKNLDVYPNKPEDHIINISFNSPVEADIKIIVIDPVGNVVSKSEEKAFKGEFMDQVRLPKGSKGTYFVIVSQKDDAISRKIKIGKTEEISKEEKKK